VHLVGSASGFTLAGGWRRRRARHSLVGRSHARRRL